MSRVEPTHPTRRKAEQRELYIANHDLNLPKRFPTNFVKTSKYTAINFFPTTVLLQFKRYANIYFLLIAILQSISIISPLNPVTAIIPFAFVLCLSILREGLEDLTRHKSDKEANASLCRIYSDGKFVDTKWKHVQVGDILLVKDQEFLPCDLVAISASNEGGVCFIETSSLDGEKNLKPKGAPKETLHLYEPKSGTVRIEGKITCMPPNAHLYAFEGTLVVGPDRVILGAKQLLLRGSKLKNTEWVVGVAVYTGLDTKTMKNAEPAKPKISQIESMTNKLIFGILIFQITLCLICAVLAFAFDHLKLEDHIYLTVERAAGIEAFLTFWSYFLLLNTMIPISLIVTLELVKLCQAYFIEKDEDMYNAVKGRGAKVFSCSINEELGQVEYIFSDKTGTLTCNIMEFKIASIGNELYGDQDVLVKRRRNVTVSRRPSVDVDEKNEIEACVQDPQLENVLSNTSAANMRAELEMKNLARNKVLYKINTQAELAREYLTILATCHECVIEENEGKISYQGPSPDEITLVDAAARYGFKFVGGSEHYKKVEIHGEVTQFEILHSFEFNSDRKRMSVIIRDPSGTIKMYVKGADSIIKARLDANSPQPFLQSNQSALDIFSKKGLRTLLVAMRVIEPSEYEEIRAKWNEISNSTSKEDEIAKLAEEIEKNLYLVGATAVEDRLQDNVPETIYDLIKANIKVWMLTGDKLETAENIAKSCNLIQPDFQVLQCSEKTKNSVRDTLVHHRKCYDFFCEKGIKKALLIEGETLSIVLEDEVLKKLFLSIAKGCEAVICCRVTPKQKAEVVRLIKNSMNKITLAIGDGANDVNMIQEAHIGVGIYGNEGMRAVQASDFAIPEFQCLWKLLFVHGRWNYIRIAEMILYFFYKNMVFTIPQFFFAFYSAYSARAVFDDFYITFYNMVFTAFPLAARALFEQDVNYKARTKENGRLIVKRRNLIKRHFPKLYYVGQRNELFTVPKFVRSVLQGVIHALVLFYVTYLSLQGGVIDSDGHNSDFWYFSVTFYTSVIFVVTLKLCLYTRYWTGLFIFAVAFLTFGCYIAFMWITNDFESMNIAHSIMMLYTTFHFYLVVALNTGLVFFVDMVFIYISSSYYTTLSDYFRMLVKKKEDNEDRAFNFLNTIVGSIGTLQNLVFEDKTSAAPQIVVEDIDKAPSLDINGEKTIGKSDGKNNNILVP